MRSASASDPSMSHHGISPMGNSRSPELSWISAIASLYTDTHSRLSSTSSTEPNFWLPKPATLG